MIETEIHAGVCGFVIKVHARSDDMQNVTLEMESTCEKIRGLAEKLSTVDAYQEIGDGFESVVLKTARGHLAGCCAGCVVPNGVFKTVQVAGGVALPSPSPSPSSGRSDGER